MYQHKLDTISRFNSCKLLHLKIRDILDSGNCVIYDKVLVGVGETAALNKERDLISLYGRVDLQTGILLNETAGGEGLACLTAARLENKRIKSSKPVSQYNLNGNFISTYPSAKTASENVPGANRSYITQVCKNKRKSAGGFIWTYEGQPVPKFTKKYYKGVTQITNTGTIVDEYASLTEAQNQTGIELHNISECCRGKSKTAGGFVWEYS